MPDPRDSVCSACPVDTGECPACGTFWWRRGDGGLPGTTENPLMDYEYDQGCMIYLPSGNCDCGGPGYVAHKVRCPIHVEGDRAPKKEWGRND